MAHTHTHTKGAGQFGSINNPDKPTPPTKDRLPDDTKLEL